SRRPPSRPRAAYSGTLQVRKHRAARACQEAVATGLPQSVRPLQGARALKLLSMTACTPRNSASRPGTLFGSAERVPQVLPLARTAERSIQLCCEVYGLPFTTDLEQPLQHPPRSAGSEVCLFDRRARQPRTSARKKCARV